MSHLQLPMRVGNWEINHKVVSWCKGDDVEYLIEIERMLESGPGDRNDKYDWMLHIIGKSWISEEDIFALNTVLVCVSAILEIPLDCDKYLRSVNEQNRLRGQ